MRIERSSAHKSKFGGWIPAVRAFCLEIGVEFTEIDLRWGIHPALAERGDAIALCLREVERSRPFFVAFVGERFGWVPQQGGVAHDLLSRDLVKSVEKWMLAGESATAMEIRHAISADVEGRGLVYLRDPSFTAELAVKNVEAFFEQDVNRSERLAALKDELRTRYASARAPYSSHRELYDRLVCDLKQQIVLTFCVTPQNWLGSSQDLVNADDEPVPDLRIGADPFFCNPSQKSDKLGEYDPAAMSLLSEEARGNVSKQINALAARFGKNLSAAQRHLLIEAPHEDKDLFLRLLFDELRIRGEFDNVDELIRSATSQSTDAYVDSLLSLIEEQHACTAPVLKLLYLTETGFDSKQLAVLTRAALTNYDASVAYAETMNDSFGVQQSVLEEAVAGAHNDALILDIGPYVKNRSGRVAITDATIRAAVYRRYFGSETVEREERERVVQLLEKRFATSAVFEELSRQFFALGRRAAAIDVIRRLGLLCHCYRGDRLTSFIQLTRELAAEPGDLLEDYLQELSALSRRDRMDHAIPIATFAMQVRLGDRIGPLLDELADFADGNGKAAWAAKFMSELREFVNTFLPSLSADSLRRFAGISSRPQS